MRILVYWEQESWGGVDTHLLELLSTWPTPEDEIVLMVNKGNAGFDRLRENFKSLSYVRCVEIASYSHNELNRRCRQSRYFRHFSKLLHFAQPLTYWLSVRRLHHQFVREGYFDLLLADNGGYPAAWGTICALEAGARAGITARLLLIHHAAMPAAMFMGLFERFVDKRVTRFATALICVSQATRSALLGSRWIDAAAVRIRVIHNSMSVGQISRVETLLDMRATVHAKPDEYLIGVAGRVSPYKGQEDMIFALARMSQVERQQIRLIFVGSGDPPEELDRLMRVASSLGVGERVHFLGYVSGRAVDIISQLDMLAVTTRSFEGFGLTLIEAMSVGVPVLATKVGAIPEFIHDDIGVLVSAGAPAELAIALSDFLAHPESWKQRAKLAMQRQSKEDMAREYRQLFVECLA